MRKFSSYGPVDTDLHYYAPRTELLDRAYQQLVGEHPEKGGHYITVWAPRQTGKSWVMNQMLFTLREDARFDVVKLELEILKTETDLERIVAYISKKLLDALGKSSASVSTLAEFQDMFTEHVLDKPLILILDEFDALDEQAISSFAGMFRNIYLQRQGDPRPSAQKTYRLHGVALIGVRSVLGIENVRGSPFNVQRSLHIPNLTFAEVEGMFRWYERESGQPVEQAVIESLYEETQGQPGLTCWFGELLTEGFEYIRPDLDKPLTMEMFERAYRAAIYALPNNNILNIISKANAAPYREMVLDLFKTEEKLEFRYDDPQINYLYQNGVIDQDTRDFAAVPYIKFACPFVQKRLFNYFAYELFGYMGKLHEPFEDLSDVYMDEGLNLRGLAMRFQAYLRKNRDWLLKDAPRRKDLRLFEALYHFSFYRFLYDFLGTEEVVVYPEFPTGNGQIDLFINFHGKPYGIELKSFTNERGYQKALRQAARYGKRLKIPEMTLISFVESVNDEIRTRHEQIYTDAETGVKVLPVLVETGN